jgi:hypothetical protein
MSRDIEDPRQCEVIQDELAELALGTLSGRSRSEALDHVACCLRCAAELERHSIVADTLLQLAREMEPPLGFELRLAERLRGAPTARKPRRLRRTSVLAAAAAVMALVGFGLESLVAAGGGGNQSQSATPGFTTANLTAHGSVLGKVIISTGRPPWMFMTMSGDNLSGTVTCDVTLAGGKVETIGVFKVSGGYGTWAAPLPSPTDALRSAELIAANGAILASARLRT